MKRSSVACGAAVVLLVMPLAGGADSGEKTVLKRKAAPPELADHVSYDRVAKEYRVTKGNVTFSLQEGGVEYCRPPRPDGFDKTADASGLEKIVEKYHRLWWDVEAFRRLMPLYMKDGEAAKAIRLYREMVPVVGPSMPLALQRAYWDALRMNKQTADLQKDLSDTIVHGGREASAWAYIVTGDILMGQGKSAEALVDGYLKAVLMFDDIASVRKVALEKTIRTMEELGDSRVERFRRMLRTQSSES